MVFNDQTKELQRALRMNLSELVEGLSTKDSEQMALSLAHSMSRFKLKFSPDKVDTMIIQAIGLMDDLGILLGFANDVSCEYPKTAIRTCTSVRGKAKSSVAV